jgi:hypothetical protein
VDRVSGAAPDRLALRGGFSTHRTDDRGLRALELLVAELPRPVQLPQLIEAECILGFNAASHPGPDPRDGEPTRDHDHHEQYECAADALE